jgi:hypothetical protein
LEQVESDFKLDVVETQNEDTMKYYYVVKTRFSFGKTYAEVLQEIVGAVSAIRAAV